METKSARNTRGTISLRHILKKLPARLLLPLFVTVAASLVYSGARSLGIFSGARDPALRETLSCLIELLLVLLLEPFVTHKLYRRFRRKRSGGKRFRLNL